MAPDIEELHEHAEHGAEDQEFAPVTLSMAILAVFAAVVTLMGGRTHAEEMVTQTRAADQWSQYQAQVIRERVYEVFEDQMTVFTLQNPAHADELKAKYGKEITRYDGQTKDIQTQAYGTEHEVSVLERRSNWFDFGEVLLESGLVICSITLLTKRKAYWYLGLASGIAGTFLGVAGMFIH